MIAHTVIRHVPLAHAGGVRTPAAVFDRIFTVFLGLGTLVGIVVVAYTLYNAYAYRDTGAGRSAADSGEETYDRPEMGELPTGGGGRKLFLSFGISAVVVLSLIVWTYSTLLYIETGPDNQVVQENAIEVDVEGFQFGWAFTYPSGQTTSTTLRVPRNEMITLNVTSRDVFHNFGSPELRFKTDAIPGQHTQTWFVGRQVGSYEANCYELCGTGHSYMNATVEVMPRDEFYEWYNGTGTNQTNSGAALAGGGA
jgi:cytochrome c oxidase subunit 2